MEPLKTVMLIDNNHIDNFINQKIIESCGATQILTFTSTVTALNHLKQTKNTPHLVFLDIIFPMMDGFEFINKCRKLEIAKQPQKIFILAASLYPADMQKAKQYKNCSGIIEKPLTKEKYSIHLQIITENKETCGKQFQVK